MVFVVTMFEISSISLINFQQSFAKLSILPFALVDVTVLPVSMMIHFQFLEWVP